MRNITDKSKPITAEDLIRRFKLGNLDKFRKAVTTLNDGLTKVNANLENYVKAVTKNIEELQNQVDGNITTWFFNGVPSVDTEPAKNWLEEKDKINHLGDLYYDQDTGYAYRYAYIEENYVWSKIIDADVVEALAIANSAKDTADCKRRTFFDEPIPPYDPGDIWIYKGEIYRCIRARENGEWNVSDWVNDLIYTDDTMANKALEYVSKIEQTLKNEYVTTKILEETENSFKSTIQSVQVKLDAKNKVFKELPTPPYQVGDLYIKNEKIYVCINPKNEDEEYSEEDWELNLDKQEFARKTEIEQTDENVKIIAQALKNVEELTELKKSASGNPIEVSDAGPFNLPSISIPGEIESIPICGKNKLKNNAANKTFLGCSAIINDDKTVTFNGTPLSVMVLELSISDYEPGTYKLLGCPTGGSSTTYYLAIHNNNDDSNNIYYDYGEGIEFTITERISLRTFIAICRNYAADNLIFKPMIVSASETNLSYESFKIDRYDLKTVKGVTNLLPCNTETQIVNGITCINNGDGTYTLDGTATSAAYIDFYTGPSITIKKGEYIGSIGVNENFYLRYNNNSDYKTLSHTSLGDGQTFTINEDYTFNRIYLYLAKGRTLSKVLIKPMLELGNKLHRFVPPGRWIEQIAKSDNKFKKEKAEIGYYLGSNNSKVDGASYYTSDFIELDCDYFSYFGSRVSAGWSLKLNFFDEYKKFLTHRDIHLSTNEEIFENIPEGAKYLKTSVYKDDLDKFDIRLYNSALIDMNKNNLFDKSLFEEFTQSLKYIELQLKPNTIYTMYSNLPVANDTVCNLFFYKGGSSANSSLNGVSANHPMTAMSNANGIVVIAYRDYNNQLIDEANNYYFNIYEGYDLYHEFAALSNTKDIFKNGPLTKEVKKFILTGDETFVKNNLAFQTNGVIPADIGKITAGICSHYNFGYYATSITTQIKNNEFGWNSTKYLTIRDDKYSTVTEFKNHLKELYNAGTPVVIYYFLEESQTYELEYERLQLHKGYNYITLNDDLYPLMEIEYLTDSKFNSAFLASSEFEILSNMIRASVEGDIKGLNEHVQALFELCVKETDTNKLVSMINAAADIMTIAVKKFQVTSDYINISSNEKDVITIPIIAEYDFTQADVDKAYAYVRGKGTLTAAEITKYDLTKDGKVNIADVSWMYSLVRKGISKSNPGYFKIISDGVHSRLVIENGKGDVISSLNMMGTTTQQLTISGENHDLTLNSRSRDLIKTVLTSDLKLTSTNVTVIPLNKNVLIIGDAFSIKNNALLINKDISVIIEVTAQVYFYTGTAGEKILYVYKNDELYCTRNFRVSGNYEHISIGPIPIDVSGEDVISLRIKGAADDIIKAYNHGTWLYAKVIG